ncbi:hypothetical protein FSP39_001172 [Pinctada imbricata]|uniref:Mab-21-like HhH/H2TH-like domain-containing protein n=1 Tax=Pinctada imbricata TaxID=66713 RepID=A0AA88Y6X7_PINIB|nr:hypothetical protein FSP39_001172 [Pinctada imbricata]
MATSCSNEELCRISKGLYFMVNGKIGQESVVWTNRQKTYLCNIFHNCNVGLSRFHRYWKVTTGSTAEGFAFESSDVDTMFIDRYVLVIDSELRNVSNNNCFAIVCIMETDNVPPGFTLLRCVKYDSRAKEEKLEKALLFRGDGVYLGSQKVREINLLVGTITEHGPCKRGKSYGTEHDCAYTLQCPYWPKSAESFVNRSIRKGWPTTELLREICKDGCHLVPIHSKKHVWSDQEDLEWRISFSLAEKKLVFSMNHCQFLCYGLMKIFLDEVLKEIPETKTETGNVLCSYFIKTAVFWEISEGDNDWCNQNFLNKFLNVFQRVIKWVEECYCPNFFIPEHNMFHGRIFGRQQKKLILRLRSLHDEGILCLSCTSVGRMTLRMLKEESSFNQFRLESVALHAYFKEKAIIRTIIHTYIMPTLNYDINDLKKTLWFAATLIPTSAEMLSIIKLRVNYILHRMAIIRATCKLHIVTSNKSQYLLTKSARSVLRKTKTLYCHGLIHQAVISYVNGEYDKVLNIVDHIHQRFSLPPCMYEWDMDPSTVMECIQYHGMSHDEIVKLFVTGRYVYNPITSIPELILESNAHEEECPNEIILIPPSVFSHFLVILSLTGLNRPMERKKAMNSLLSILYRENNHHIEVRDKAISWEILGICQQLCGDYVGAYQSYINALNDKDNEFKQATIIRILSLFFDFLLGLRQCLILYPIVSAVEIIIRIFLNSLI